MKDIDFDELDKAVNSLMGAPGSERKMSNAPASNPPTNSAVGANVARSAESVARPAEPIKKSGRFMDVVHPSSDMRTSSLTKTSSRGRVSITPPNRMNPIVAPVTPKTSSVTASPVSLENSKEKDIEELPSKKLTPDFSFPDPLELLSEPDDRTTDSERQITSSNDNADDAKGSTITSDDDKLTDPIESLFLPDVKVDKRPLGVASANEDEASDDESIVSDASVDNDTKKVETLVTPDPTLAELANDVLAIESDSNSTEETENSDTSQVPTTEALSNTTSPSDALASAAISSIPRQYTVKPSSDNDKHHEALYDSAAQAGSPLQHLEKKKSGWLVIIWIVLLIVVGVGGALALYFLNVF